jgi:hypothetical protein
MHARTHMVFLIGVLVAGCGEATGDRRSGDRPASAAAVAPVPRPMTPSDSACPRDGRWKACALEDRIGKAGMMIKVLDTLKRSPIGSAAYRYKIGKVATMAVLYFLDSAAAVRAVEKAGVDPLRLTPRGDSLGGWPAAPREVIRSANLIAVLFDVNATQAERVRLAITAGAPVTYPGLTMPNPADTVRKLPPVTAR